jgi:uncharacterized protein YjbI with pentapeptide repeats
VLTVINRRNSENHKLALEREKDWRFDLRGADLRSANLSDVRLETAILSDAHLEGANLQWAHLESTNLRRAHLQGANLREAHFGLLKGRLHFHYLMWYSPRGDLQEAHLEGADLRGATGLTTEMLAVATGDAKTKLPDSVARPAHWPPASAESEARSVGREGS